jgi:hypothetical protein
MTSIYCDENSMYEYNDVEKQLPEYTFPIHAGEQFYIHIFPEDEMNMDITNRFDEDTPDESCESDHDIETGQIHIHCSRLQSTRLQSEPASSAIPIIMTYFKRFLHMFSSNAYMQIHPEQMTENTGLHCYSSLKCTLNR